MIDCLKRFVENFSNMAMQSFMLSESFVQESKTLPPKIRKMVKEEICGQWPKVISISNWCTQNQGYVY